jgi:uncharacterized membrane protein YphA (DoxX/SURF4 family)
MQRLYSMFPRGAPGCGLIILRLTVVASLNFDAVSHSVFGSHPILLAALLGLSSLLALGLLTPAAAVVSAGVNVMSIIGSDGQDIPGPFLGVFISAVLIFLGPGAFSIDARIFGRRIVVEYADRFDDP